MPDSIPIRVARGVKYLDDHKPEWRRLISAEDLDMASCRRCVLGQLFESFNSIKAGLFLCSAHDSYDHFCRMAESHGLEADKSDTDGMMENYDELTAEWRKHLANPEYILEVP